ncbi:MAG: hypothetical protein H6704_23590 [Myxococcales bacterium]|nr:hypothetical protein [Myxococcales bacterium]
MAGDGCSGGCQIEAVCGDGTVDATEACDDGNTTPGDGCDATCRVETPATDEGFCGDGIVQPGEACDPAEEQAPGAAEYRLRPCNDDCTERKEGCGCRATDGAPGGALWLLLVGLWGVRRRRG